ncbi:cytochrome c biogenesis CcdA family protein [Pseudoduganella ginsengisoli]|uniref:Cytochrome c biogenesis protein CcdA n=1 Tax=Pseudoduganella ginsengisoli TaxID=1462440 RepID=A0A6L6Q4B7_9BURK|nr:cytochrome c biogenesis CcdA family protein [Pseudoduganella ginsengisoli]MTW04324.1 cytochrome c biogenesis protein CcdA [Pseudoduganella ginsengisoli]
MLTSTPNLLELPLALLAGVFTVASPCILPIVPIVLGSAVGPRGRRPLFIVAGFVLAFASFAMLLGAASSLAGVAQDVLRSTAIAALALAGVLRIWPQPYDWLVRRVQALLPERGGSAVKNDSGNLGGFVMGMSLGAVWTPCAGPVLAAILALVVKAQAPGWSAALLAAYAIGAGIPMLAIIYGGQAATTRVRWLSRHAHRMQQVFGVLVVATAMAIYLQYDVLAYAWAAQYFPNLKGL